MLRYLKWYMIVYCILAIFQLPPRPQNKPISETIQATSSQPVSAGYPTQPHGYSTAPPPGGYNPGPPGYPQQPPPYSTGPPMPQPGIGFAGVGMYVCMHACIVNDFHKFSMMS